MLLVEDKNFCEMLQYYCISDVFHNYLLRFLDIYIKYSIFQNSEIEF